MKTLRALITNEVRKFRTDPDFRLTLIIGLMIGTMLVLEDMCS